MKINDVREMNEKELELKVAELRNTLYNLKTQAQFGRLEKPIQLRQIRRDIARVKTVLEEQKSLKKD